MSCMEAGSWKKGPDGEESNLGREGEDILQTNLGASRVYSSGFNFLTYKMVKLVCNISNDNNNDNKSNRSFC